MLFILSQKRKRKFSGRYLKPPFISKRNKTRVCGGKLNGKQCSTLNKYHIYNSKQLYSHKHSNHQLLSLFYSVCVFVLFHMHFNLLRSHYGQISNKHCIFRCVGLLKDDAYFDLSSSDGVLIKWRLLFDVQCLLKKIRYFWKVALFVM